jgi:hypothetical protein
MTSEVLVTHRVNAAVDAMQPPTPHTAIDGLPRKSKSQQLPAGDHPVLATSKVAD